MRAYASPQEAFDRGDYLLAVECSPDGSELKGSACVLAGFIETGVKTLERLARRSDLASIHLAYGYWCLDRHADASRILSAISGPQAALAAGLLQLVNSPSINVFVVAAHVPIFTAASDDLRQPSFRCGQFAVKHVCTQLPANAYDCALSDPFDQFIDSLPEQERPRFIYLGTPEWFLPRGIERVRIPKVVLVHDTDFFMYRSYENYFKPDVSLVCTSQEHYELTRGLGIRCAVNLFSDAFQAMPEAPGERVQEKTIDVLFSGAAVDTATFEKARFMFQLSRLSGDFNIKIFDGHLEREEYQHALARAKFLPIVNRYRGQSSPRWRDALSEATLVLSPAGVPYGEICEGFFPFREEAIAEDIRRHLKGYAKQEKGSAYDVASIVAGLRERFPKKDVSLMQPLERNFKFCALMALEFERREGAREPSDLPERWCWLVPQIDCYIHGEANILAKIGHLTDALASDSNRIPSQYCDLASLHIQRIVIRGDQFPERDQILNAAFGVLEQGLKAYPKSLLLRFNRAHWSFFFRGDAGQEAAGLFEDLAAQVDQFEINPLGADIGLGYAGLSGDQVFPYYEYAQMIVSMATASGTPFSLPDADVGRVKRFLAGCALGYVGIAHANRADSGSAIESFRASLRAYPDNPRVARLMLAALIKDVAANEYRDAGAGGECVGMFYAVANRDPSVLLTETCFEMMEVLLRFGLVGQLTSLIDDWYGFARTVIKVRHPPVYDEIKGLARLFRYREHFPERLERIVASWSKADRVPEAGSVLDLKIFAAMCSINSESETAAANSKLKEEIAGLNMQLEQVEHSTSWRVTKPLRSLSRLVRAMRRMM